MYCCLAPKYILDPQMFLGVISVKPQDMLDITVHHLTTASIEVIFLCYFQLLRLRRTRLSYLMDYITRTMGILAARARSQSV